jgi:replicative DNA helicase
VQLFTETQPIDLLTVSAQLKKNAKLDLAGGDFYLIQLTQKISSSAHIEFHSNYSTKIHTTSLIQFLR